jgi:hypothetical protein
LLLQPFSAFLLSLGFVLVGAKISPLYSAVIIPAANPPTAAPPTPKPRQSLLTVLTSAGKMKATAILQERSPLLEQQSQIYQLARHSKVRLCL